MGSFLRSRMASLSSTGSGYTNGSCFTGPADIRPVEEKQRPVRDPRGTEAPLSRDSAPYLPPSCLAAYVPTLRLRLGRFSQSSSESIPT